MKDTKTHSILLLLTVCFGFAFQKTVLAQGNTIPYSVVGNGGEKDTSTKYILTGTVGQAKAAAGLSTGSSNHDAGFWAVFRATSDFTSPAFSSGYPTTANVGGTSLDLKLKINEGGKAYYVVLTDESTAPTPAEVKAGTGSGGTTAVASGSVTLTADTEGSVTITGLASETAYDIYVAAEDDEPTPNVQSSPTKIDVTTKDVTAPAVSSLSPSDGKLDVTINANLLINFSENVAVGTGNVTIKKASDDTNFEVIDVTSTKVTVSGVVVTVDPQSDFASNTEYYVFIDATAFHDLAGNDFAAISDKTTWNFTTSAVADLTSPSAASAVVKDGSAEDVVYQNSLTSITANWAGFSDDVGVISYEWAIGTTSGGTDVQNWTEVGNVTTVTNSSLTLTEGNIYYVSVRAKDAAGNVSGAAISDGVTVDATAPTVTISSTAGPATSVSPIPFAVSFSESVTGFEGGDVTLGNGTLSGFSGSGAAYTFNLTASKDTTVTVDIASGMAQDVAGNGNTSATQFSIIYDTTPPTAGAVNDGSGADIDVQASTTTIQANWSGFSDAGSGIASYEWAIGTTSGGTDVQTWTDSRNDTSVSNSSLTLTDGTTYYVSVRAKDGAGNVASAVTSDGVTVSGSAITVSISSTVSTATTTSPVLITVTFSEEVTGFDAEDVTVGNGTLSSFSGSGATYTFNVTPSADGQVTVDVGEDVAQDIAGNNNTAAIQFKIIYDTKSPTVGNVNDGTGADVDFQASTTVVRANWSGFSDAGSGIVSYEWALRTILGSVFVDVKGWTDVGDTTQAADSSLTLTDGTTYYVFVRARDAAGNVSQEAFSDGVTVNTAAPAISISSTVSSPTNVSPIPITVTFSVGVIGFVVADVTLGNGTVTSGSFSGSDTTYTFTVVPSGDGTMTVDIREHVAQDEGGNNNTAATQLAIVYDGTPPTSGTVIDGVTEDLTWTGNATILTATWSGFVDSLTGIEEYEYAIGTTPGGTETVDWTGVETDTSQTRVGLSLSNGTTYYVSVRATDAAGNTSAIATSNGITIDTQAPERGTVADGRGGDVNWTNSSTTLSANWSGFADTLSGISRYENAIGSNPGGTDLADWTTSGLDTFFTKDGLVLTSGTKYYISVRAIDEVGNTGDIAISDGVTVDLVVPTVSMPREGSQSDDLDWQQSNSTLDIFWTGSDNLKLSHYEYTISTVPGDSNIVSWTNIGTDTSVSVTELNLSEGITYYSNVRAYDMANNVSDVASGDGIQVDLTAPTPGIVNDGLSEDISYSSSLDTASCNWSGFDDTQSGISHYEIAIGSTPDGTDILNFTDAGSGESFTRTGLSLVHGNTYYFSVRAIDLVDNVSDVVSSDGFTVDVYPGPPSLAQVTPETGLYLPLIGVSKIVLGFSEPITQYNLSLKSFLGVTIEYEEIQSADSLVVTFMETLTSFDTVEVSLKNVTDMSGQVSDEMTEVFHSALLADYTADLKVDVNDLSIFTQGWKDKDFSLELGPVTGEVPHFVPHPDTTFNLRDAMSFTRMWHWWHQQGSAVMLARQLMGEQPDITQSGRKLIITAPEEGIVGEIFLQYLPGRTDFSLSIEETTEERLVLSTKEGGLGQLLVDFGYLIDTEKKDITFDTQYLTRENSSVAVTYLFYGKDQQIIGQGTKEIELRAIPRSFALHQNYPNPFNPVTTIEFDLPEDSKVTLVLYDILGRQVRTFVNGEQLAGYHSVVWGGKDRVGRPVSTGVYIYRIHAQGSDGGSYSKSRKLLLLK